MRWTAWIMIFCLLEARLDCAQDSVIHVVQKGDSMYSIAKRYGVTVRALEQANKMADPRSLRLGQRLQIPLPPPANPPALPAAPEKAREKTGPSASPTSAGPEESEESPSAGNGPSGSNESDRAPAASSRRYVFLDKVIDQISAPRVIPGRWRYIVLHHSGTSQGGARAFGLYHQEHHNMPNGLAYHFVIGNGSFTGDGEIEVGGRWLRQIQGGHLKFDSLNEIAIGICFVGNFDETRPSRKQIAAAIELISYLREACGPRPPILMTHTEIHPHHTDCPGRLFPTEAFHTLFPGEPNQAELNRLRSIPNSEVQLE